MKSIRTFLLLGYCLLCLQAASAQSFRKSVWTVAEVKAWSESQKDLPTMKGLLLYQGSDSAEHYFISRVMDEWMWFRIKKNELVLEDEKPLLQPTSSGPLGYYYVDPRNAFRKTAIWK